MLITAARRLSRDSLARNSLLIMATTVSNGGLGYLYWMLAARTVPPYRIGTATALISAATAVSMIANLGAGHMFIQRLPGSDTGTWSRIVGVGLSAGTVATVAASAATALVIPDLSGNFAFLSGPAATAALIATAVAITLTTLLDNLYVAHRAGHGMLLRNLAVAGGKLVTLVAVLAAGFHGAVAVLLSWTLPALLICLVTIVAALGRLRPGARPRLTGLRTELPHLRSALTGHHLINLTQAGPAAILPVLVTARLGADANAHFYLAWMTASMLFMVSPAVASALYAERTNAADVPVTRAAVVVLAVVGGPAVVLLFAGDLVLGLFSAAYAVEGGPLLRILVLAALPDAVANLAVAHWRSRGEFRLCRRLNLVRAVTCLLLAWLLLPTHGVTGAGLAWLAGQTAAAVLVAAVAVFRRLPTGSVAAGGGGCADGPEAVLTAGRSGPADGETPQRGDRRGTTEGPESGAHGVPDGVEERQRAGGESPTRRK
ncbi:sugar transporter [Actinoplanes sp. NPDC049802]|uniref:lipopolysaccharide biosynthesis protein n=1 Tax=Actinoplanes sp. NPDC049802 TaxID=3154742 RepID=UPI0033D64D1B